MKKRFLSIVLVLSMLCTFVPLVASAAISGTCGENLTWTLDDSGTLTISGTGDMTDWESPSKTDQDCPWHYCAVKVNNIVIKNGVTSIGNYAFQGCKISSIEIPDSVITIGEGAFGGCSSLTSIDVSNNVMSIGSTAFSNCCKLTSINVDKNNPKYCSVDGNLFNKDKTELMQYAIGKTEKSYIVPDSVIIIGEKAFSISESLTSVEIPDSVTRVGDLAFSSCRSLTNINLPSSIMSIGEDVFSRCESLTNIKIPSGVTSIGDFMFYNCKSLTSIEIPNGVTHVGYSAFYNCESLTSIKIPSSITWIGDSAFYNCKSLTNINVDQDNVKYCSIDGSLFNKDKTELLQYAIGKTEKSYMVPNGVTNIGDKAFSGCGNLTSIELPSGVTSIGDSAFYECDSLASIELPSGVMSIGNNTFYGSNSLTSIELPSSVTSIGNGAFYKCDSLTDVYYNSTKKQWNEINIGNYNDDLKNAIIHYILPMTTATITKEETSEAYTFNVEPEQKYEDCYVYEAMYDENGLLTGFNRIPLETSGSTTISIDKTDKVESAKVFVLSDMLQPVIQAQEFNIE